MTEKQERDQKVLQLFLAGASYRQIMAATGVKSTSTVHLIVQAGLDDAAGRRELLSSEALAVYQERTEQLFRAHWGAALRGDHKSAEVCRRILEQQGRLYGLGAETRTVVVEKSETVEDTTFDELARRRTDRGAVVPPRRRVPGVVGES